MLKFKSNKNRRYFDLNFDVEELFELAMLSPNENNAEAEAELNKTLDFLNRLARFPQQKCIFLSDSEICMRGDVLSDNAVSRERLLECAPLSDCLYVIAPAAIKNESGGDLNVNQL